jgi:alpha-glucosidase
MRWLASPPGSLVFARDPGFLCVVNVSAEPMVLPDGSTVVLSSGPLTVDGRVPADTTVWLGPPRG